MSPGNFSSGENRPMRSLKVVQRAERPIGKERAVMLSGNGGFCKYASTGMFLAFQSSELFLSQRVSRYWLPDIVCGVVVLL